MMGLDEAVKLPCVMENNPAFISALARRLDGDAAFHVFGAMVAMRETGIISNDEIEAFIVSRRAVGCILFLSERDAVTTENRAITLFRANYFDMLAPLSEERF